MRHSLRARIFAVCFAVGTGVSVLFGVLSLVVFEVLEFEQIDLVLDGELARFMTEQGAPPDAAPVRHLDFVSRWAVALDDLDALPAPLRSLAPGRHEVDLPRGEVRVLVSEHDGRRYLVAMELAVTELLEDRITGAVILLVVVCSLLGALLGRSLARRVAEPVTRLAAQVASGTPLDVSANLADGQRDDEIGALARALQDFLQRVRAYARREQEFTAHVSHELRTPLAVAGSAVELLLEDARLGEDARRRLLGAQRSLAGMHQTVEALLMLARTQSGAAAETDVDLATVLGEEAEQCRALLAGRPVALHQQIDARPVLHALPGALRIVVRNLLANACAQTAEGEITVHLAGTELSVRDTGAGIAARDLPHVRDARFRGDNSRGEGEGLGLAIVQRLCEHYGWRLEFDSAAGAGAVFTLHFG